MATLELYDWDMCTWYCQKFEQSDWVLEAVNPAEFLSDTVEAVSFSKTGITAWRYSTSATTNLSDVFLSSVKRNQSNGMSGTNKMGKGIIR